MIHRPLVNAAVLALTLTAGVASAQDAAPNYNNLKRTLERKFAPEVQNRKALAAPADDTRGLEAEETRSLPAAPASSAGSAPKADAAVAAPKALALTPPPKKVPRLFNWLKRKKDDVLDRRGALSPHATPLTGRSFAIGSAASGLNNAGAQHLAATVVLSAAQFDDASVTTDSEASNIVVAQDTAGQAPSAPDGESLAPVARSNSYVIQLKPEATEAEIAKLLEKYNLNVTKVIGELGVITVESNDEEATRGLDEPAAPADTPAEAKKQLETMLEPPLIKELREEGIVDAAIVNSTISAKVLPRSSGVSLQGGGKSFDWSWGPTSGTDGNWGLKNIRIPPVWTILNNHRKSHPDAKIPKVGVIDLGFTKSPNITFQSIYGSPAVTVLKPDCSTHHGMHVAGIVGAKQGETAGIDGMIPNARVDAIGISNVAGSEAGALGVDQLWELQTLVFDEVLGKTMDYLVDNIENPDNLRVINISLGYNFLAKKLIGNESLDDVSGLKLHIHHQASILRKMAQRVENKILFVVAAGNDSDGRTTPLAARWSSPFAWAGTFESSVDKPSKNILVIEAAGRDGKRAPFSNTGGHLSAPGVDIMSTLASSGPSAFGVCSGTSQAAPHVAALAAILFELDPSKKPVEIAEIMKSSARPVEGGAPEIDALEAVMKLSPAFAASLADLDGDGQVGAGDLAAYKRQSDELKAAAATNASFTEDLNGDGVVDDNECRYPRIDLNGSGSGTGSLSDVRRLAGLFRSDLQTLSMAWLDAADSFKSAVASAGITDDSATVVAAAEPPATANAAASAAPSCRQTVTEDTARGLDPAPPAPDTPPVIATPVAPPPPPLPGAEKTPSAPPLVVAENPNTPAQAQDNPAAAAAVRTEVQSAIKSLKRENPKLRVTINPATGLPSSISGFTPRADQGAEASRSLNDEASDEDVKRIVEGFFATSGLTSSVNERAFATRNKEAVMKYVGKRRDPDFPERTIATVEQQVDGIPVFGSTSKLTLDQLGAVSKYTGNASQVAIEDTTPAITEAQAIEGARVKLKELFKGSRDVTPIPLPPAILTAPATTKLIVYDPAIVDKKTPGPTRLSYLVTIEAFKFFVEAKTGEVFHYFRDQQSGMIRRVYDMARSTVFLGTKVADEQSGEIAEQINADSITAFRNAGMVRDYFFMLFGRDSYDDNDGTGPKGGGPLESFVRYGSLSNAYWCPQISYSCPKANVMVYGPGYAESIDIAGHEMTHGVIQHEKNLIYMNESGAVNESFADIFGTLIELYATIPYGNWVIGEKLPGYSDAAPMRDLANPNLKDRDGNSMFLRGVRFSAANRGQPDHYADVLTPSDPLCGKTRMQDNGCVHFNSGILNKFAYLVSEGGTQSGISVSGIGRVKLARIAYRTMTAQLNESSGLIEAADGFELSCLELSDAGRGGITFSDCNQVNAAKTAVGLVVPSS